MAGIQISLAAARVNAGMTQLEAARQMRVSKQTIINWEKGRIVPRIPEMEMLSRIYNMPQDYIFYHATLQKVDKNQNARAVNIM